MHNTTIIGSNFVLRLQLKQSPVITINFNLQKNFYLIAQMYRRVRALNSQSYLLNWKDIQ